MDFVTDFGRYVDRTVLITDGCAGALDAHEIYFTALASKISPIRLTGNYGSEVLRGMSTFKAMQLAPELFAEASGRCSMPMSEARGHPYTRSLTQRFVKFPGTFLERSRRAGPKSCSGRPISTTKSSDLPIRRPFICGYPLSPRCV